MSSTGTQTQQGTTSQIEWVYNPHTGMSGIRRKNRKSTIKSSRKNRKSSRKASRKNRKSSRKSRKSRR